MWPADEQTDALLAQARAGDKSAARALLEQCRPALRRMIELRLSSTLQRRVDASDVVQEVLLAAHGRFEEYLKRGEMPFQLWLRHIARDRMIDAYRRHAQAARRSVRREQAIDGAAFADRSALELSMVLADRHATPATEAVARELRERFVATLDAMDEIDREVICMRHLEHLSNKETAQALGLTEPAAGMRYLRAMRRLRALLAESPSERGSL